MQTAGDALQKIREALGLSYRDVEHAAERLAERHANGGFCLPAGRLHEIENGVTMPSILRLYTLAVIYRQDFHSLLQLFGVDLGKFTGDLSLVDPPRSHIVEMQTALTSIDLPRKMDPGFNLNTTTELGRMIQEWGTVPLQYLKQFDVGHFLYCYIGRADRTMYPLVTPGSLVQVDTSRTAVEHGPWPNETERPIYLVETRAGYVCSWCDRQGSMLLLQSHPLSGVAARLLAFPRDAEVLGQVVAVAKRLVAPSSGPSQSLAETRIAMRSEGRKTRSHRRVQAKD